MEKGVSTVQRRTGANLIQVPCPNDIQQYQKYMGGVDRGDQHRVIGAGFSNVAHFKKWYKKCFLGIADFSMLQAFAAWNISIDECSAGSRGGMRNRRKLIKWQFYAVAAEEFMSYVDKDEQKPATLEQNVNPSSLHRPQEIPSSFNSRIKPMCMICSMEESIERKVSGSVNRNGRKFARRTKFLAKCAHPNCNVIAHTCCPQGTKMSTLPQFNGMNCFEIAHMLGAFQPIALHLIFQMSTNKPYQEEAVADDLLLQQQQQQTWKDKQQQQHKHQQTQTSQHLKPKKENLQDQKELLQKK